MTQINDLQNNDLEQPFAKRMIWNNKLQKMILSYQARQLNLQNLEKNDLEQ